MGYRCNLIIIFFCASIMVFAQESKIDKAKENFDKYDFIEAIEEYEALVKEGYNDIEIYQRLGDANFFNSNYKVAAKWYRGLYLSSNSQLDAEYLFRYALSLKSLERYDESNRILKQIQDTVPNDTRLKKYLNRPNYLKDIQRASDRYNIYKLSINSTVSDFAPSFYGDTLVFSSAKPLNKKSRKVHGWNDMPFLNIYFTPQAEINDVTIKQLEGDLNSEAHESSTAFTKDGKTVYFTRNNFWDGDFIRDSLGVSRLKIYRANKVNNRWTDILELSFSSDNYSVAHPCLNADESKLYFVSDMPGSVGNSDIYYVDIKENGTFGPPINLGPEINTEGRESFPFVSNSNILYFASDGHPGLGGLDIFAAKTIDDGKLKVLNIGTPINSINDDFGYIINEKTAKGYFTSNREGGLGSDDIYSFLETKSLDFSCVTKISGVVVNGNNGKRVKNTTVQLIGVNDNIIDEVFTDATGSFSFNAECTETSIKLLGKKEEFFDGVMELDIEGFTELEEVNLNMKPSPRAVPKGTELSSFLGVQQLKFDFGKTYVRPDVAIQLNKVYIYLRDFPQINIEIQQHTDSRGSENDNFVLSRRRAKSIKDYLISTGIDKDRILVKGMGESMLANHCANGVRCTEGEHQQNNRTEFIVIN